MARDHELHLAFLLKHVIRSSDFSARAVERQLGMSGGYISRLTSGRLELKISHLFDILDVLGLTPNEFFALAFPLRPGVRSPLMTRLLELSPPAETAQTPAPLEPFGESDRKLLESVRRVLAEIEKAPKD
jgi:transcriptional regulator with XRE-family HTH domain